MTFVCERLDALERLICSVGSCLKHARITTAYFVDLPVAFPSGELIQEVWDRWLRFDPVVNVHERLDNLRMLSGILLDAGAQDDYNLHWGHRLLSHYLAEAGIPHEHRENPGNHGGRANERYQMALAWLATILDTDG